jgi:hypothetical protein
VGVSNYSARHSRFGSQFSDWRLMLRQNVTLAEEVMRIQIERPEAPWEPRGGEIPIPYNVAERSKDEAGEPSAYDPWACRPTFFVGGIDEPADVFQRSPAGRTSSDKAMVCWCPLPSTRAVSGFSYSIFEDYAVEPLRIPHSSDCGRISRASTCTN